MRIDYSNLIQKKFNMLTVLSVEKINGKTKLKCQCECKKICYHSPYEIINGHCKSCGCLKAKTVNQIRRKIKNHQPRYIDGKTKHPLYGTWQRMIDRCENPKTIHYDCYGGRGISVCKEWRDFWKFVEWSDSVGGRPKGYTLDRKDNDGNYEPSNCRWADWDTQSNNKSSNITLTYNEETKTIQQWSKQLNINPQTLLNRYNRGWSTEELIETPANVERKSRKRPIVSQFDLSGNLICEYENLSCIPKIFNKENVRMCCVGKRQTHKGYMWKYKGA